MVCFFRSRTVLCAGLIGEVVSGRADIAVSQITASATRFGYVDQSVAFIDAPMGLLAHASTERPVGTSLAVQLFGPFWVNLSQTTCSADALGGFFISVLG